MGAASITQALSIYSKQSVEQVRARAKETGDLSSSVSFCQTNSHDKNLTIADMQQHLYFLASRQGKGSVEAK